jgi:outer membrane protein assembly factor BamB
MKKQNHLFIFSNGKLAAINKQNGEIVWEVKVKTYLTNAVSLVYAQLQVEGDKIYLGTSGILLCLSTKDGSLIWKNVLKGWGYQFVHIAGADNSANIAAANVAAAAVTTM